MPKIMVSYVSRLIDSTPHDDYFLHAEKGLWIFSGSQGDIGQGSNSDDGHGIWFTIPEDLENLVRCSAF